MKERVFIYGITNKIIFDSSIGEMRIRPGHQLENEWSDFVYINLKLDNIEHNFNIFFNFVDDVMFWALKFIDDSVYVVNNFKSVKVKRGIYVRLLYDSHLGEIVGVGSGNFFSDVSLSNCNIECNFLKNWLLSPSSRIDIVNCDTRPYSLEIKGMVITS
tara:strand:- start:46 stop:522 length:477 start_codon:yes stop_codon:yes gene_type:complete